ncbi:MAG: putative metal-binding motif-containing protein [Alphaproteobacteria bacterium]|nr:putative metal-binding motif-containing protein [Alphaproteobacteria bacterium]
MLPSPPPPSPRIPAMPRPLAPVGLVVLSACIFSKGETNAGWYDSDDSDAVQDQDGDGYPESEDCDDLDAAVNPGAAEVCDGQDNNCDGEVDEGCEDTGAEQAEARPAFRWDALGWSEPEPEIPRLAGWQGEPPWSPAG